MAATPESNEKQWTRAKALQISTKRVQRDFNLLLAGLAESLSHGLRMTTIGGLGLSWKCEPFLGGSAANQTATKGTDMDILLILKPSIAGYTVEVELVDGVAAQCQLRLTPLPSAQDAGASLFEIGDVSLDKIWQSFREAVRSFTREFRDFLNIPEVGTGERATFEDFEKDSSAQMWASFSMGATEVDVLPAFKTRADEFLVLLRSCNPDGSNIVQSFSQTGARRIASLPDKARQLVCALKHVVKDIHGIKVPGCLFESAVFEVFDDEEWIELDEDRFVARVPFVLAWSHCLRRIREGPISAPNKPLVLKRGLLEEMEAENRESAAEVVRFKALVQQLETIGTDQLLELLPEVPVSVSAGLQVVVPEINEKQWTRAKALQISTKRVQRDLSNGLAGLAESLSHGLRMTTIGGLGLSWKCEPFIGGAANQTATKGTDMDILLILKPSIAGYTVEVELVDGVAAQCQLRLTPLPSAQDAGVSLFEIGDVSLDKIWQSFREAVRSFTREFRDFLNIPEVGTGERATFEDDAAKKMWAKFSMGATEVDVLPAFKTRADEFLVLLRSCNPDGSNIVQSFSQTGARRIASLPDKARQLVCALKHVVKDIHGIKVPGCLFESAVFEVFDDEEWIELDEDRFVARVPFVLAWSRCLRRIREGPISAPNKPLVLKRGLLEEMEAENRESAAEVVRFKALVQQLETIGTDELLALLIAIKSPPSTSTPFRDGAEGSEEIC